jgi:hypothetical protein
MLLLQRHTNESVVIHNKDDPSNCAVVRVCDVYPTGDVTLGFIADKQLWSFVRTEIFNQRTTLEESLCEENLNKEKYYATQKNGYYG